MQKLLLAILLVSLGIAQASDQAPASPAKLKPGDSAPEFSLRDQNGKALSLRDFRGKTVVLAFYVFAFTGG